MNYTRDIANLSRRARLSHDKARAAAAGAGVAHDGYSFVVEGLSQESLSSDKDEQIKIAEAQPERISSDEIDSSDEKESAIAFVLRSEQR